jgi:hypothetical protein
VGEDAIRDAGRDARVTVADAAERLGITKEAVRKRISRGTLRSYKDPDGTVWVYIPSSGAPSGTPSGTPSQAVGRDELVELLRAQLEDLRADRDAWRDQARRSDYMASSATDRTRELESRLRELEAPASSSEAQEPSETAAESVGRGERFIAGVGTQEGTQRHSAKDEHPRQPTDPGLPHLTPILAALSMVGVGSVPLFVDLSLLAELGEHLNIAMERILLVSKLSLALFALPFIFGLYRGVWNRRLREFREFALRLPPDEGDERMNGGEAMTLSTYWGTREVLLAFVTAAGAALVAFIELLLASWNFLSTRGISFSISALIRDVLGGESLTLLWVFIGTFLFYVFAVLIGAATGGGERDTRDVTPSQTGGRRLISAASVNPQLIFGLVGTIITAIATVFAASLGG